MSAADPQDPRSLSEMSKALRSLPSLSILTAPENLFSERRGIYLHPQKRGGAWERPVRIEFLDPANKRHFEVQCGLRIHGGTSRRPEESPKHSFRLVFNDRYGPGRLRFPLFRAPGGKEFETLVLRAGGNDSWLESNGQERSRAVYLRDEWMRRTMAAMGYGAVRGMFIHVYLNDLYWGVYNLCEDAGVAASNDFDVIKEDAVKSGDRIAFDRLMWLADSSGAEDEQYREISSLLDVQEFADYMVLNLYAGNADWDRNANWYALRPRRVGGRFQFLVWDAERTLGDVEVNALTPDDEGSPVHLFHRLCLNKSFRALFAASAQRLCSGEGPLAPANCASRFAALAETLEPAMAAEAARWGSYHQMVHQYKTGPYEACTVQAHWNPEVRRIRDRYFRERQQILFAELRARRLLPRQED